MLLRTPAETENRGFGFFSAPSATCAERKGRASCASDDAAGDGEHRRVFFLFSAPGREEEEGFLCSH